MKSSKNEPLTPHEEEIKKIKKQAEIEKVIYYFLGAAVGMVALTVGNKWGEKRAEERMEAFRNSEQN